MTIVFMFGISLWIAGTIGIRLVGHHLLQPDHVFQTLSLYLASFVLMALLVPLIFARLHLEKNASLGGVTVLILPTLLLDPFSCAFFASVFPNLDSGVAGIFGGWMLICCAGAVAGAWTRRWR